MFLPRHSAWFLMDLRVVPFCTSELSSVGVVDGRFTVLFGDQILQMINVLWEPVIVIAAEISCTAIVNDDGLEWRAGLCFNRLQAAQ